MLGSNLQNLLIHGHLRKLHLYLLARALRVLTLLSLAAYLFCARSLF
jgi:hypothetical protein